MELVFFKVIPRPSKWIWYWGPKLEWQYIRRNKTQHDSIYYNL